MSAAPLSDRSASPGASDDWPLVSAIVATRGRPELVQETVEAVVAQTYPGDIECLVVHDQEEPVERLTALGAANRHVSVTTNTHSAGLAGARNTGIDLTSGAFVATCDDDDTWHPHKTELQVRMLTERPELLMVGGGIRLRFPGRLAEWPARAAQFDRSMLLRSRVKELHSSTLMMRRDTFAKAGRYDEDLPFGYAEDYDWVLRVSRVGRIGAVIEPVADIRKDVPSWYKGRADRTAIGLAYLLDKHPEINESRRGHARMLAQIGFARSAAGDARGGMTLALRALARWPLSAHAYLTLMQAATRIDPSVVARGLRHLGRGTA
ncbi:MAG: glycosyltransferase family 2 protein [Mycobacteriales bacterium]|nr:MAG: glycosyl transferase [Pseudonocardiales bacterium]